MNQTSRDIIKELDHYASDEKARNLAWFFKTGEGEYGEGDQFIGVSVPNIRKVCKNYMDISLNEVAALLSSKVHEHRLAAVILLTQKMEKSSPDVQTQIVNCYLEALKNGFINNWDIVDLSAGKIIGEYLKNRNRNLLINLARSDNMWQRRVAIISTSSFIAIGESKDTIRLAKLLLKDKHDLIHKAVGWMLREVGKRVNKKDLTRFLDTHAHEMPRVMLRYACERLSDTEKRHYYSLKIPSSTIDI